MLPCLPIYAKRPIKGTLATVKTQIRRRSSKLCFADSDSNVRLYFSVLGLIGHSIQTPIFPQVVVHVIIIDQCNISFMIRVIMKVSPVLSLYLFHI